MDSSLDYVKQLKKLSSCYVILLHFGKELVEEVLNVIPKDYCVSNLDLEAQVMQVIKYVWDFLGIKFGHAHFRRHPPPHDFHLTKTTFLSRTSTLFDLLGMVSPFTVRGRMMLQVMWTAGLAWDEKLPAELGKTASTWFKELPDLSQVKIPRSLKEPGRHRFSASHIYRVQWLI